MTAQPTMASATGAWEDGMEGLASPSGWAAWDLDLDSTQPSPIKRFNPPLRSRKLPGRCIYQSVWFDRPITGAQLTQSPPDFISPSFPQVLAHRIGLIPIKADPRLFDYSQGSNDTDENSRIVFQLNVKCEMRKGVPKGAHKPEDMYVRRPP